MGRFPAIRAGCNDKWAEKSQTKEGSFTDCLLYHMSEWGLQPLIKREGKGKFEKQQEKCGAKGFTL